MTKATLKKSIHKTLDNVNDESVLTAIYILLNNSVNSSLKNQVPFSISEYLSRQKLSLKQIKEGKVKSHSAIKKRYSN